MLVVVQIVDDIKYVLLQSVILRRRSVIIYLAFIYHAMRNLSNCLTHYINQSSVRHYTNDKIIRVKRLKKIKRHVFLIVKLNLFQV